MPFFSRIYKKLLTFYKSKYKKHNLEKKESYIGYISFKLKDNDDIDILYATPDIQNVPTESIADLSEKYAKFLCDINDGILINEIIETLTKNKKDSDSEKNTLLIDNILFFWALTHIENEKAIKKQEKSGQPMIKPLDVFKTE
jgi:hypothetical protein